MQTEETKGERVGRPQNTTQLRNVDAIFARIFKK